MNSRALISAIGNVTLAALLCGALGSTESRANQSAGAPAAKESFKTVRDETGRFGRGRTRAQGPPTRDPDRESRQPGQPVTVNTRG